MRNWIIGCACALAVVGTRLSIADVVVTPSIRNANATFEYRYAIQNTGAVGLITFSLNVFGQPINIVSPAGWNYGIFVQSGQTRISWASSDPQFDIGTGSTLAGFGFESASGPGPVRFDSLDDTGSSFVGTTSGPVFHCTGDFNQDGGIDGSDVESFFEAWEAGHFAADVNADGGIDGTDVEFFFDRWENGC